MIKWYCQANCLTLPEKLYFSSLCSNSNNLRLVSTRRFYSDSQACPVGRGLLLFYFSTFPFSLLLASSKQVHISHIFPNVFGPLSTRFPLDGVLSGCIGWPVSQRVRHDHLASPNFFKIWGYSKLSPDMIVSNMIKLSLSQTLPKLFVSILWRVGSRFLVTGLHFAPWMATAHVCGIFSSPRTDARDLSPLNIYSLPGIREGTIVWSDRGIQTASSFSSLDYQF